MKLGTGQTLYAMPEHEGGRGALKAFNISIGHEMNEIKNDVHMKFDIKKMGWECCLFCAHHMVELEQRRDVCAKTKTTHAIKDGVKSFLSVNSRMRANCETYTYTRVERMGERGSVERVCIKVRKYLDKNIRGIFPCSHFGHFFFFFFITR